MKNIMKNAWQIRKESARKFNCSVKEICFSSCLKLAWKNFKKGKNEMKTACEYKTPKGSKIKIYIRTETENFADHNFKNECFDLIFEMNGKDLGPVGIKKVNGIDYFSPSMLQRVNGKDVRMYLPIGSEALKIYNYYEKETTKRFEAELKNDQEYQTHYNKVNKMMNL